MKTKNRHQQTSSTSTKAPAASEQPPESSNGNKKEKDRIQLSFDVNENGAPDYSSMREKTRERLRQIISDPKFAEEIGIPSPAAIHPEVQVFHPAMVGAMYDMMGAIEAAVIPMFFPKVPHVIAKQVFTYTPTEKEMLNGPTTRVLNKYAAEWMIKYQDEIALAGMLVSLTVGKVN